MSQLPMRTWRVMPKGDGERWLVFSPDGEVTEFVTGGLAIEFGRLQAQEAHERLMVYGSDDRIFSTEDFRLH